MKLSVFAVGSNFRPPHQLDFARADADSFCRALSTQTLYEAADVLLSAPNLTSSQIRDLLNERARSCQATDCVVFLFSGHGLLEEDSPGEDCLYLVCDQTDPASPNATALPLDATIRTLEESPANIAVCFLDCCFSGYGGKSILGPRSLRKLRTGRQLSIPRPRIGGYGRVVLAASGRDEVARETSASRHGVFTAALLAGLTVPAARSIPLAALYNDVQRRVMEATAGQQCPSLYGGDHGIHLPTVHHDDTTR